MAFGQISAEKSGPASSKMRCSMSRRHRSEVFACRIQYVPSTATGTPRGERRIKTSTRPSAVHFLSFDAKTEPLNEFCLWCSKLVKTGLPNFPGTVSRHARNNRATAFIGNAAQYLTSFSK